MGFRVMGLLSLFRSCKAFRSLICHHFEIKYTHRLHGLPVVVQQLVSAKIPPNWVDHLDKLVVTKNLSRSALVKVAIGQYLGLSEVDPALVTVDLRSELGDIRARLEALERSTKPSTISSTNVSTPSSTNVSTPSIAPKPTASTPKPTASTPPIAVVTKLMRSGELLIALQARGYTRSAASLLRDLNESIAMKAPNEELAPFGVKFDFEAKRSANPRSSNLRWLWIED